jgi:hypothetical protein
MAVIAATELDWPRFETAFAFGHQHDLARSRVDNGAERNGRDRGLACIGVKHHVGVHIRLQPLVRIGDFDAYADGTRFGPHFRIDERHDTIDRLVAIGPESHLGVGAQLDVGEIAFGDIGDHPDIREVDDPIEFVAGDYALAVDDALDNDRAAGRRRPIYGARVAATVTNIADAALG